jgi:hypothetical protein
VYPYIYEIATSVLGCCVVAPNHMVLHGKTRPTQCLPPPYLGCIPPPPRRPLLFSHSPSMWFPHSWRPSPWPGCMPAHLRRRWLQPRLHTNLRRPPLLQSRNRHTSRPRHHPMSHPRHRPIMAPIWVPMACMRTRCRPTARLHPRLY